MTQPSGSEQPLYECSDWVLEHLASVPDAVQQVMTELPQEDRGRWAQVSEGMRGFVNSQPPHTPAGKTQGLRQRSDLRYRTIYTRDELKASLNDPAPLHFAPGAGPEAEPLTLDRTAAGGAICLYGGLDRQPLALLTTGRVHALEGAVIASVHGGHVDLGKDATISRMDGGYCNLMEGATVVDLNGGLAYSDRGTVINKRNDSYASVIDGRIENHYDGDAHLEGGSQCSTVHGGRLRATGRTVIGEVISGSVELQGTGHIASVRGGYVTSSSTTPITEVSDGTVDLHAGAGIETVTGGTVHAYPDTTIHKATGGTIDLDDRSVLHHADGTVIVNARTGSTVTATGDAHVIAEGGSTVTLHGNAHVHAYDRATVVACGGTVHLYGTQVDLTDHGATIIREP